MRRLSLLIDRQFLKGRCELVRIVRLRNKSPTFRQVVRSHIDEAGSRDDLDRGPTPFDRSRQFQAIHAARHLNVREQNGDVRSGFKN